jgi:hypothetical protein
LKLFSKPEGKYENIKFHLNATGKCGIYSISTIILKENMKYMTYLSRSYRNYENIKYNRESAVIGKYEVHSK